ncbi:LAFE_0G09076g1_1 [Lachancea fermentati]|uniref:Dihydrofolate reductase n=1 Tax=Lachancea fermentati TaxID=4955 RepID=A0A1G4MHV3_LACFM|nr:LAFE_0G09076g1_1 [Lachancea fermentati]
MTLSKPPISSVPVVCVVACLMPELGIGCNGALPWRLPREMANFKRITSATFAPGNRNAVVMGRKTWQSIPPKFRPLPGRANVVVSRQFPHALAAQDSDAALFHSNSLTRCLELLPQQVPDLERIYVIGGGEVYAQSYTLCDAMLITEIEPEHPESRPPMDTFLDVDTVHTHFERAQNIDGFLPPAVHLPTDDYLSENGYRYKYALYKRPTATMPNNKAL